MLIDFGKASHTAQDTSLTQVEKVKYQHKFPLIPSQVIEGASQQSTFGDMYAVGGVLYYITESGNIFTPLYRDIA